MTAALQSLQVDLHLLDIKTGSEASPWVAPDWVLNVNLEAGDKQQSGMSPAQYCQQYCACPDRHERVQHFAFNTANTVIIAMMAFLRR